MNCGTRDQYGLQSKALVVDGFGFGVTLYSMDPLFNISLYGWVVEGAVSGDLLKYICCLFFNADDYISLMGFTVSAIKLKN